MTDTNKIIKCKCTNCELIILVYITTGKYTINNVSDLCCASCQHKVEVIK